MPYGLPQPSTLDDIFSANPGAFFQAQQMVDGGMRQNEADLEASQLKNLFDQQNNQQLVEAQGLSNQFNQARIPGVQAESDMSGMKRDMQRSTQSDAIKAARDKFMADASDNDLKMLENEAQKMAMSMDPNVRKQGTDLLMHHKDIIRDKAKQEAMQERALALEAARGANMRSLTSLKGELGAYSQGGKKSQGVEDLLLGAKTWQHKANILEQAYNAALRSEDYEAAAMYQKRLQAAIDQDTARLPDSQAGKIDVGAVANMPTNVRRGGTTYGGPALPANQLQQDIEQGAQFSSPEVEAAVRAKAGLPAKQNTPQPQSLTELQQLYPGVSPEKLREAYKKKFGKDIK